VLQATDRHGALVARLAVTRWPVTVGRALTADLVLDDSHVAADHLRIDSTPEGEVVVQVLKTANGVALQGVKHGQGAQFNWPAGRVLTLGRLKLGLRMAHEPLPAEEPLPHFPWRMAAWTVLALAGMLALVLGQSWLSLREPSQLAQRLPGLLMVTAVGLAAWAGLWALATKLFTGRLHFWRHVRIACVSSIAVQLGITLAALLAFMFSLESLARFDNLLTLLGLAAAVYVHLTVMVAQRRRSLAAVVAGVALLGIATLLGSQWLQNQRLSNRLYMSAMFPPSLRVAPAVPVQQFLLEAGDIRRRLDDRLKDRESDGGQGDGADAD
jgi:hypothetical protein